MSDSERRDSFYDGDEDVSYDDIGSERLGEIYDSESSGDEMAPPPAVPPQEMKLSREKKELTEKMAPPPDVPPQEMKLRREKKELTEKIAGLTQEIGYKDEIIDLLKIHNETCKKERDELTRKIDRLTQENEKYILLLEELSIAQRKLKGGTRHKRFKNSRRK